MLTKNVVAVFSGFNQRAVISFLRVLEELHVPYGIIACSPDDPIHLTGFREKIVSIRKNANLDFEDLKKHIEKIKSSFGAEACFITPSAEALNRFLLVHRDPFEAMGCIIPLVQQELYNRVSDKYSFGQLCAENGIRVPKEYDADQLPQLPFVAKPKTYFSPSGNQIFTPVLIQTPGQQDAFKAEYNSADFYYQEFVTGESYYLLYYFDKQGKSIKCSQKNLVQQAEGKSIIAGFSSDFHLSEESGKYEALFKKINFRGLIMIEVRKNGEEIFMIEANPRLWGPSQLFIDAGTNLFFHMLKDYGLIDGQHIQDQWNTDTRYFWFGGLVENLRASKEPSFHNYSLQQLVSDLPLWLGADVYRRGDAADLFFSELS